MLELRQIRLPFGSTDVKIEEKIRKVLRMSKDANLTWEIARHSVDARNHSDIFDVYTLDVRLGDPADEMKLVKKLKNSSIVYKEIKEYKIPPCVRRGKTGKRPVVVGFGPAGIFASLILSSCGLPPVVLERGAKMEERLDDVSFFWESGNLSQNSNVQFGEGGAGTFSDGKLSTGVGDPEGRKRYIFREFTEAGAPEDIAYEQYPHIGTDKLRKVVVNLRKKLISSGCEIRFRSLFCGILSDGGKVCGVKVLDEVSGSTYELETDAVIFAAGHSARDTFRMLYGSGLNMTGKNFAVGFRVSHPQEMFDRRHFGERYADFTPSSYKLTGKGPSGRGVYSFCMCPGGYIVNASSEEGRTAVNGMSDYARDSGRANSAIVLTVGEETFGSSDVLSGLAFQEKLEEKTYRIAGGRIPVQFYREFKDGFAGHGRGETADLTLSDSEALCLKGRASFAPLYDLLPADMTFDFISAMEAFDKKYPGFVGDEAFLAGTETRTSSPVRIIRDENFESSLHGFFPCGEGAGYAGGIMSAAIDGIKVAEAVLKRYNR